MTKDRVLLLLSILFALLLWIPQKLTKTYRHKILLNVSVNVPDNRQVVSEAVLQYPIEISGKGSKLYHLSGAIKRDTLRLPFDGEELTKEFFDSEIISTIRSQYNISDDISIRPELSQLAYEFDSIMTKVVPIKSMVRLSFQSGYGQVGEIKLEPTEVTVKGPHDVVSAIQQIATADISLENLTKNTVKEVDILLHEKAARTSLSTNHTILKVEVDQLIEKEILVPLEEISQDGKTWKLFPDKILVRLSVPMRQHASISADDIQLTVQPQGEQAVSVSVAKIPNDVHYISHSPKIVRYFE
jgi:YbbR domain-containing protein